MLIPLMKAKFVDEYGWLKENEALDLVSIAQSAPGVMAANSSIIMGYRMGGFLGSVTALLATILPPLITLTIISFFYDAFASNSYVLCADVFERDAVRRDGHTDQGGF